MMVMRETIKMLNHDAWCTVMMVSVPVERSMFLYTLVIRTGDSQYSLNADCPFNPEAPLGSLQTAPNKFKPFPLM